MNTQWLSTISSKYIIHAVNETINIDDECRTIYPEHFKENMLCAGGACIGDNGNSLIQIDALIGMPSRALMCENVRRPTMHTRVSSFIDWIKSV